MPKKNESDLVDIPKELRRDLKFALVERMDDVLESALLPVRPKTARRRKSKPAGITAPIVPPA